MTQVADKPAWMGKLRDRNIGRRVSAVDQWAATNLQAFEQLAVVDGAPAAVDVESSPDRRVSWLAAAFIVSSFFVPISFKFAYVFPGMLLLLVVGFLSLKRHFVAVTDRRFLVQQVSLQKAVPMGSISSHPVHAVSVVGFKRGKGRPPSSVLTISIAEPSGAQRKMTLAVNEVVFPGRAEAIRRAIEPLSTSPSAEEGPQNG